MPVTEFVTIQLNGSYTLQSDPIPDLLTKGLTTQTTRSSYPVYVFTDAADASIFYIMSGWQDIAEHMRSIESDTNQEVMKNFVDYVTVKGMVHPEIDFRAFPKDVSVVTVEKYAVGQSEAGLEAAQETSPPAKWVGTGVAETNEGYKISAYVGEEATSVLSSAGAGEKDIVVMRLAKAVGV